MFQDNEMNTDVSVMKANGGAMKKFVQYSVTAAILLVSTVFGVDNPNVGPGFGPSTVPSAGQGRRMITSSDPMLGSGNNIVTGNVGGMKYFRGVVPYGSSYYTGANASDLGSSSVDAFIRRSANPIVSDRNPGQVRPFYQPERSAAKFVAPQTLGIPSSPMTSGLRTNNPFVLTNSPQFLDAQYRQRPLSADSRQIEELLVRQNLLARQPLEKDPSLLVERPEFDIVRPEEKPDIRPQIQPEETPELTPETEKTEDRKLLPEEEVHAEFQKEHEEALREQKSFRSARKPFGQQQPEVTTEDGGLVRTPDPTPESTALGRQTLGQYKTYASLAQAKYDAYMNTAEGYFKEGKFYKAADVYELASVWLPEASRAHLGKGFALFGAGEYMSSAYYVARAIELEPELAARSINLDKLIGDRDVFENRMVELNKWQQQSGAGELAFLMAYVYYHDGKTAEAAQAISIAVQSMPDSPSVKAMQNVITSSGGAKP
jgi:tetratricopeptide (TPR) repeat protein